MLDVEPTATNIILSFNADSFYYHVTGIVSFLPEK